jgi:crotonobetainyl-CoA:carnitine CoA-transferase CaiB-like acyl-CoA transferase
LALFASILAALRLVERTGEGQVVDVSLLQAAAWTMSTDLSATLVDGVNPPRTGRRSRNHALHGAYRCADDRWILLFMPEPKWWPLFCNAVGHPEWIDDERFVDIPTRRANMSVLTDLMDPLFAERTLAEWGELFDAEGFIWGPGSTIADFAADPQAEAVGLFPTIDHPDGAFRTIGAPLSIAGADVRPRGPAPEIGEHTAAVLTELGLDEAELAQLVEGGIVGPGVPA